MEFFDDVEVELIKTNASDLDVCRAAWVSTVGEDARTKESDKVAGLIGYLMKNRHLSCFEHGSFTFFVKAPLFVFREFHRHRTWSYNELSGRYSEMKPEFYLPPPDRNLIQIGKVGEYEFVPGGEELHSEVQLRLRDTCYIAWDNYQAMLNAGVAKEVARMCLPLNLMSAMYATVNPRNLMAFLSLRTEDESAKIVSRPQAEIQMVADKIELLFEQAMPLTYNSWNKNGRQ